jgi:hypothetical protein
MPEDFEERFARYEDMTNRLIAIAEHQRTINDRQDVINERLVAAIERLDATQADIKVLLATLIERGANGRGA